MDTIFRFIYDQNRSGIVNSCKPKFYKRFVGDIITRRNKNQPDDMLEKLNSNYRNMKCTVEVKPEIFLDGKIAYTNDVVTSEVKRKERKLAVHWSSKVPKRLKGMLSLVI